MYGGAYNWFFKRYVIDYCFKVQARIFLIPSIVYLTGACLGQRDYDNNAYDYFYFSD